MFVSRMVYLSRLVIGLLRAFRNFASGPKEAFTILEWETFPYTFVLDFHIKGKPRVRAARRVITRAVTPSPSSAGSPS